MKASKGFILVSETLCFCFSVVLLLAAARAYYACLHVQEYTLRLEEGWQVAQLAAAGQDTEDNWRVSKTDSENNGVRLTEVQVYDVQKQQHLCTLAQAEP